ncbi:MAG TPA: glutathione S-transferase N-terminal domain-containing protein [Candidatus Binataceae bacterium]|nr:glutathione S-transferase N-terminal domain-containing protein [Candidatus Binataceae bacterium]
MLTLYYAPGACSMASHIGIEESGAPYETKLVSLTNGEQRSEAYLRINPRGKVPALSVDGAILTENTAILTYLAKKFPAAKLLLADPLAEARCISTMAWFSNIVHPSFTHINRPERFADDPAAHATLKATGRKNFWANVREIDALLEGKDWMMGTQYTVCDPYALVFYGWGVRIDLPMKELAAYTAFKDRMLLRPAVRKILEREQSILLTAAPAA